MTHERYLKNCLTLLWRIDNIGSFLSSTIVGNVLHCPKFISHTFDGTEFYISLPMTDDNAGFGISLKMLPETSGFSVDLEFSILGVTGSPLVVYTHRHRAPGSSKSVHYPGSLTEGVHYPGSLTEGVHYPGSLTEGVHYESEGVQYPGESFPTRTFVQRDSLTVRIRVWKSFGDILLNEFISCRSRVECMENSFPWLITGFRQIQLKQEVLAPMTFDFFDGLDNFTMNFQLDGESLENAVAKIQIVTAVCKDFETHIKVSILDNQGSAVESFDNHYRLSIADIGMFLELISREELIRRSLDCLRNDVLTLKIQINVKRLTSIFDTNYLGFSNRLFDPTKDVFPLSDASCQTFEHEILCPETSSQTTNSMACLVEDLLRLYETKNLSDFQLLMGDKSFPVHKMVLCARSPVFKDIFSDSKNIKCLDILDMGAETLNRLLTYLYTGTLKPNLEWEDALQLYNAADKYQVYSLNRWCFSVFCAEVCVSNVSDILKTLKNNLNSEIAIFVIHFIFNHYYEIEQRKEWKHFMDSDEIFADEIMQKLIKMKNS